MQIASLEDLKKLEKRIEALEKSSEKKEESKAPVTKKSVHGKK